MLCGSHNPHQANKIHDGIALEKLKFITSNTIDYMMKDVRISWLCHRIPPACEEFTT